MGINLQRTPFFDWMVGRIEVDQRPLFLDGLFELVGTRLPVEDWTITDETYPRLSSYAGYDVFRECLYYLQTGETSYTLGGEQFEMECGEYFRSNLKDTRADFEYGSAIVGAGDCDTLFIPYLFKVPYEYGEDDLAQFVTSLPGAVQTLEELASVLAFDLRGEMDQEVVGDEWQPIATIRNIARIMYQFLVEKPGACVDLA